MIAIETTTLLSRTQLLLRSDSNGDVSLPLCSSLGVIPSNGTVGARRVIKQVDKK